MHTTSINSLNIFQICRVNDKNSSAQRIFYFNKFNEFRKNH